MVLVKAAPVLTSELRESVCVAAMTLGDDPRWIRLHPVPFRDLGEESQFKKYQEIQVRVIRWRFRYKYRCLDPSCNGHNQTIVDWEAVALYRNVRREQDWRARMTKKFVHELWANDRDTRLFVGNMEQRPWNFLVLGIFWPPRQPLQQSFLV